MKPVAATFHSFRPVGSRKCCQLILEVPIEQANEALQALGGVPDPANPLWVGIVALDGQPKQEPAALEATPRRWEDLSLRQQAGIRCSDPDFQKWLGATDADEAARLVRRSCGVRSRRDLDTHPPAAAAWRELDDEFYKAQRGLR